MGSKNDILALAGAVIGGVLGYFGFLLLVEQGFYALALPGALAGIAAGAEGQGQGGNRDHP